MARCQALELPQGDHSFDADLVCIVRHPADPQTGERVLGLLLSSREGYVLYWPDVTRNAKCETTINLSRAKTGRGSSPCFATHLTAIPVSIAPSLAFGCGLLRGVIQHVGITTPLTTHLVVCAQPAGFVLSTNQDTLHQLTVVDPLTGKDTLVRPQDCKGSGHALARPPTHRWSRTGNEAAGEAGEQAGRFREDAVVGQRANCALHLGTSSDAFRRNPSLRSLRAVRHCTAEMATVTG